MNSLILIACLFFGILAYVDVDDDDEVCACESLCVLCLLFEILALSCFTGIKL